MSNLVKYGTTKKGVQRFLNKDTGLIVQEKKTRPSVMFKLFVVYMTLRGVTRHGISVSMGISSTSVYNWCRIYDQQVRMNYDISDKFTEDITEIEVDELYHKFTDGGNKATKTLYYDKKGNIIHEKVEKEAQRIYVLTATDTKSGKQIANKVVMTNTNEEIHNFLDEVNTKYPKITTIHSDGWSSYKSYCNKNEINHTNTKNLTHNVERNNGLMRDYLGEIKRRAKAIPHNISVFNNRINTLFVLINNNVRSFLDFMKFNELYFSKPFNLCYQL